MSKKTIILIQLAFVLTVILVVFYKLPEINLRNDTYQKRKDISKVAQQIIVELGNKIYSDNIIPFKRTDVKDGLVREGKNEHAFSGEYHLYIENSDGSLKNQLDPRARLLMDIYPEGKGDGLHSVVYADGSVELIEVSTPSSMLDIKAFLSIKKKIKEVKNGIFSTNSQD